MRSPSNEPISLRYKLCGDKTIMTESNPYKVYADERILNASPIGLIVALYEGAIETSVLARKHLASGDIPARTKAITKLNNILNELMRALNDEKGGEISSNLRRLYLYMQSRAVDAHTKKRPEPLQEVERLLSTMLEGWRAAETNVGGACPVEARLSEIGDLTGTTTDYSTEDNSPYGNYLPDIGAEYHASSAYSF